MLQRPMKLFALAALLTASGTIQAAAGGYSCCSCAGSCAPLVELTPVEPFYIVNQGPTYSGPGIVLVPGYVEVDTAPATYPYVGRDYYFPSYPGIGRHHVHRRVSDRRAMHKHPRRKLMRVMDPRDK